MLMFLDLHAVRSIKLGDVRYYSPDYGPYCVRTLTVTLFDGRRQTITLFGDFQLGIPVEIEQLQPERDAA